MRNFFSHCLVSCHHKIELIDSWLSYHWRNQVPCPRGGLLAAALWRHRPPLHLLCFSKQEKYFPRYHQMWARPPEMLVLGFQEDGWVPHPPLSPSLSSTSHLMLQSHFLSDLVRWLLVVIVSITFFSVGWKESWWQISKCKLASSSSWDTWTRVMLLIKRVIVFKPARPSQQIYLGLVLISM